MGWSPWRGLDFDEDDVRHTRMSAIHRRYLLSVSPENVAEQVRSESTGAVAHSSDSLRLRIDHDASPGARPERLGH
jgi:hypothetical protein